jgi:tetratricopeptide (TPR) repeat protein
MQPGERVGRRFEILRRAGSGGMGAVYQAFDTQTGDQVAIKFLLGYSHDDRARFEREAIALAGLSHPTIVRYIAHGATDDGEPYLVMEWLEGEDLAVRLRKKRLGVMRSLRLARHIAAALAVAHRRGIVHRDLKPTNLFLVGGSIDRVKLLDFGIAWLGSLDRVTRTGALMGTPGYMAPEQARGEPTLTPGVDVFATGCVLFEALSGKPAFQADNALALLAKVVLDNPPHIRDLCPEVPPSVEVLVGRMLAKDPAARPADGAALVAEIEAAESGAAEMEPPPSTVARPGALGGGERRVFSVVLIGRPEGTAAPSDTTLPAAATQPLQFKIERAAHDAGAHLERLADGSMAIALGRAGFAKDRAAAAAHLALSLRILVPDRGIALATGQGEGAALPLGAVIDRAARRLTRPTQRKKDGAAPVAIDEVTAALLDPRFEWAESAGEPVLIGEREHAGAARTLLGKPTPCVGRERELRMLEGIFAAAVEDRVAQAVLVTAPAGMGKSRLLHELMQLTRQRGDRYEVWVGRGDSRRIGSSLGLLGQALRGVWGVLGGEPLPERRERIRERVARRVPPVDVRRVAEFLGEIVGTPFPDDDSAPLRAARRDPQLMGEQMLRAFLDYVRAEAETSAVVLVLEDLHWGDAATVRFVDAALRSERSLPLVVIALARPEVHQIFPRLWAERDAQELRLRALPRRACEEIVLAVLGKALPPETVEEIVTRADGNAFYLEELIRAAAEGRQALPETIVAMVQSRLEGLEPEARKVLRAASIFGEVFWRGSASALLGGELGPERVGEWLSVLVDREVLVRRGDSRFSGEEELAFRQSLLREGAYAMLTDADRAVGHRVAAEWLEEHGEADALVLAEHFESGGAFGRAAGHYLAAAEQATRDGDLDAARARVQRGLDCDPDDARRAELLTRLLAIRGQRNEWSEDTAALSDEIMRAWPPGSGAWLVGAGHKLTAALHRGDFAGFLAMTGEFMRATVSPETVGVFLHTLASCTFYLCCAGRFDIALECLRRMDEQSAALAEGDPVAQGWVLLSRSNYELYGGDDPFAALCCAEAAVRSFEEADHRTNALRARIYVGICLSVLGARERAEEELSRTLGAGHDAGTASALRSYHLVSLLAARGALEEARTWAARMIEDGRARRFAPLLGFGRSALAEVMARAGQSEAAEQEALAAREHFSTLPIYRAIPAATLATLALEGGRPAEAIAAVEVFLDGDESPALRSAQSRLVHALALRALGREDEARWAIGEARARLREMAARIADPGYRKSFLEDVPENARTLECARRWRGAEEP